MSNRQYLNGMKPEDVAVVWIMHAPFGSGKASIEVGYRVGEDPLPLAEKPIWMTEFRKSWEEPSNPVTFEFMLLSDDYAQEALNYIYNEPATREP